MDKKTVYFKPYDLQTIKFKIDNLEYSLDPRVFIWSIIKAEEEEEQNPQEVKKKKSILFKNNLKKKKKKVKKTGPTFQSQYVENAQEIKSLIETNEELDRRISQYQDRLAEIRREQQILIDEYVLEHLETEKVKNAREKLNSLKKELGL